MDLLKEKHRATHKLRPEHRAVWMVHNAHIGWTTPPRAQRAPRARGTTVHGPRHHRHRTSPARARAHGAARAMVLNNLAVWAVVHTILYRFQPVPWLALQWKDCWARARCGLRRVLEAWPWERGSKRRGRGAPTTRNEVGGRRAGAPQHAQKAAKTFFFLSLYRAQSVPSSSS